MSEFKVGSKVKFTTIHKRTGSGKITHIDDGPKGSFYSVKEEDGKITKCRLKQLEHA